MPSPVRFFGPTQPLVTAEPRSGYWTETDEAIRLSEAQDRYVARRMNHDSEAERAVKFGSLPTTSSEGAA